jgi:chromosome segregation ATPase
MSSQPRPQLQASKEPYQPIFGNGTRPQPHPVDQDPLTIDQRLYCANSAISESLQILSSNRNTITSLTRTCTAYQQRLEEWSKAYTALEIEHKKTCTDLENMTRNHCSVSQQLKEASRSYESAIQEYERGLQAALGHAGQNVDQGEMREYQTALAEANDNLNGTKQELDEMREMKRDYQNRLGEAHGQLHTCQQNLSKLHKEKEDLIRKHRDALSAAEDHAAVAKERIAELEKQQSYEQMSLRERNIALEKKVDSIREHRDALAGAWEAAEKNITKLKEEKAGLIQEHQEALATAEETVEKKIAHLEKEKAELIQEHQDALAAVEEAAEKKIAHLEKEKEKLTQQHRDALAAAEVRAMVVPERITEPEKEKVGLI